MEVGGEAAAAEELCTDPVDGSLAMGGGGRLGLTVSG